MRERDNFNVECLLGFKPGQCRLIYRLYTFSTTWIYSVDLFYVCACVRFFVCRILKDTLAYIWCRIICLFQCPPWRPPGDSPGEWARRRCSKARQRSSLSLKPWNDESGVHGISWEDWTLHPWIEKPSRLGHRSLNRQDTRFLNPRTRWASQGLRRLLKMAPRQWHSRFLEPVFTSWKCFIFVGILSQIPKPSFSRSSEFGWGSTQIRFKIILF